MQDRIQTLVQEHIGQEALITPVKSSVYDGRRSETFMVVVPDRIFYAQIYEGDVKYQALKKALIFNWVQEFCKVPVPIVYGGESKDYSYLLSEAGRGKPLRQVLDKVVGIFRAALYIQVGKQLAEIHSRIPAKSGYGWITDSGVEKSFCTWKGYLEVELNRILTTIEKQVNPEDYLKIEHKLRSTDISTLYQDPVLVWFDLNLDNLLASKLPTDWRISCWLDPGAARFGPPEWDIARAKVHLCKIPSDFTAFMSGYHSFSSVINKTTHLDGFEFLVRADDLALAIEVQSYEFLKNNVRWWRNV